VQLGVVVHAGLLQAAGRSRVGGVALHAMKFQPG
jgi:hypothetical protein